MGVSLDVYRAAIGLNNAIIYCRFYYALGLRLFLLIVSVFHICILLSSLVILIILSGSVHRSNPGPCNVCMSVAHLIARSLNIVDKFCEISAIAEFQLFAFSETWLKSSKKLNIWNMRTLCGMEVVMQTDTFLKTYSLNRLDL